VTDEDGVRLARRGSAMWESHHPMLALILKRRRSLRSHDSGPRSTVSAAELVRLAETAAELSPVPLLDYLRECGIEVTDD
jgi:hypothetical protein